MIAENRWSVGEALAMSRVPIARVATVVPYPPSFDLQSSLLPLPPPPLPSPSWLNLEAASGSITKTT